MHSARQETVATYVHRRLTAAQYGLNVHKVLTWVHQYIYAIFVLLLRDVYRHNGLVNDSYGALAATSFTQVLGLHRFLV